MNFKWEIDKRSEYPALSYLTMQHATVLGNPATRRMGHNSCWASLSSLLCPLLPPGSSGPLSPPSSALSSHLAARSFLSSRSLFLLLHDCQPAPPTSQGTSAEAVIWGTHLHWNAFLCLSFLRINSANKMSKMSESLEIMSGLLLFLKTSILMKCI